MSAQKTQAFRTIGITTCWSVDQAEQMLLFLDALREDIWARYAEDIARQHHHDETHAAVDDSQLAMEFDELPF